MRTSKTGGPPARRRGRTGGRATACALLAAVLLLPAGGTANAAGGFADVRPDAWYTEAITYCVDNGWMQGTSALYFEPEAEMRRAMLTAVLHRVSGAETGAVTTGFTDVAADSWYSSSVTWALESGLITGYGDGRFGPDDALTREQLVTLLWRYAGSPAPAGDAAGFTDGPEIAGWAAQAVAWAVEAGLIEGRPDGGFDPQAVATRAEAAAILTRFLAEAPEEEPEETPALRPNSYDNASFVVQDGFLTYTGTDAESHVGVDVSAHQGEIDWARVAASGVEFAIIRAGYRGYTAGDVYQDAYFTRNIEGALAAGLDVGVYFFSQAVSVEEAVEEAEALLAWIEGYDIRYPVIFDWERIGTEPARTDPVDGATITACAQAFCSLVEQAGYLPMTYANPYTVFDDLDIAQLSAYPFWLAHYTTDWQPTFFAWDFQMWQYTSSGRVDGIEGNVDLNLCLVSFPDWQRES